MSGVITINVAELVIGTSTNASGCVLFLEMDRAISNGDSIKLSLKNCPLFSSSFLNSSIGELFDKYGDRKLKGKLMLADATAAHVRNIKNYIDNLKHFHNH